MYLSSEALGRAALSGVFMHRIVKHPQNNGDMIILSDQVGIICSSSRLSECKDLMHHLAETKVFQIHQILFFEIQAPK